MTQSPSIPTLPTSRSRWRRVLRLALYLCIALLTIGLLTIAALILWPLDPAPYLATSASPRMLDRHGRLMHPQLNADEQWCLPVALDDISPWLIDATLAAEDQRFFHHPGVDPVAAVRAAGQNAASGRIVSGASTLTMQLVKLTRGGERTLPSKMSQAALALRLDARADKHSILAAYLNKAPYGMNLVGCEAASRRYFGKPSRELTLSEAALLAGLPRSPSRLNPLRHPEAARERRDFILARMRQDGRITLAQCREAQAQSIAAAWNSFPAQAPHLARRLRHLAPATGAIQTSLEFSIQSAVEAALPRHVTTLPAPINNAAAIVVDVATAEVLARAGSADFFAAPSAGQVDAARARRSPGSTLKPFIYALAMEQHRLYASEKFLDAAIDYGLYNPANFDGEYNGLITASDALRQSLNVPAVAILERIGVEASAANLRRMGVSSLSRASDYYGLGLALGSGEVRLEELAEAYTALAALGVHRPLRYWSIDREGGEGMAISSGERFFSRGACLQIFSVLAGDGKSARYASTHAPVMPDNKICWKTGTSTGRRDAWAVAFDANYVVAVWVGNTQGQPSYALTGAGAALPLALEIFRALPPGAAPAMPDPADDLCPVEICSRSGLPASPACPVRESTWMATTQLLNRRCALHAEVVTADGARRAVERWPASARHWDLAAIAKPALASVDPSSMAIVPVSNSIAGEVSEYGSMQIPTPALRILSPAPRGEFILTGDPRGDSIRLRASTSDVELLSWYLDGRHIGASSPDSPLWLPLTAGEHTLACMNRVGNTARAAFIVHARPLQ